MFRRDVLLLLLLGTAIPGLLWFTHDPGLPENLPLPAPLSDEVEDIEGREHWFVFQRTYPFNEIPPDSRATALRAARRRDGVRLEEDRWVSLGPTPAVSQIAGWGRVSGRINALAVSPADPNIVLIGASTGGMWRSIDGGLTALPVSDDQADLAVGAIAFSRSNPNIAYAAMGDSHGLSYLGSGVLKSTDAGATWTRVSGSTLPRVGINTGIAVDPLNDRRVYVSQYAQLIDGTRFASGVYVSSDGGTTWSRTLAGLPRDVAVHPREPNTVFAALTRTDTTSTSPTGLYKSSDGGRAWSLILQVPYDRGRVIDIRVAVSDTNPSRIYVYTGGSIGSETDHRVYVTSDGGTSWESRGASFDTEQFGYNTHIIVHPTDPDRVFVSSRDVWRSMDAGLTWTNLNNNFNLVDGRWVFAPRNSNTHPDQHAIAFSPADPNVFYLANDGGLSKSADGGETYESLNDTLSLTQFYSITVDPNDPSLLFGGTQDNSTLRWQPNSPVWDFLTTGDGGHSVIAWTNPGMVFTTINKEVWRFRDYGRIFDRNVGPMRAFEEPAVNPRVSFVPPFVRNNVDDTLYYGTWRLFKSSDLGATWAVAGEGLDLTRGRTAAGADRLSVITPAPSNPDVIYTGSEQGRAMRSMDAGLNWTDITGTLPNRYIKSIVVDPQTPSLAYLSVSGFRSGHVFRTEDFGESWTDISGNLPDIPVSALLIDPLNPATLYAGTDVGVFKLAAGGRAWTPANAGLPPVIVTSFAAQPSGLIRAGTYGRGTYELLRAGATSTAAVTRP